MTSRPRKTQKTKGATRQTRADRFKVLVEEVGGAPSDNRLATSSLADSVGFLLRLASGVSQGRIGARLDDLGLRLSLYSVMLIIRDNPGLKQQEVGLTLSIQQPNLVALINQLTERGLVTREVNADDRRSFSLFLTAAGQTLLRTADKLHDENEKRLAEAIAPMKLADFKSALRRVMNV